MKGKEVSLGVSRLCGEQNDVDAYKDSFTFFICKQNPDRHCGIEIVSLLNRRSKNTTSMDSSIPSMPYMWHCGIEIVSLLNHRPKNTTSMDSSIPDVDKVQLRVGGLESQNQMPPSLAQVQLPQRRWGEGSYICVGVPMQGVINVLILEKHKLSTQIVAQALHTVQFHHPRAHNDCVDILLHRE
ncbi:hypothetical protein LguiB_023803 [Lonicera macranthoides]